MHPACHPPLIMKQTIKSLLLVLALAMPAAAEDFGSMPYAKLYALFQDASGVSAPNIRPTVAISSTNKEVKPAAITLTIQARSGPIKVALEPDGEIRTFPMSEELLKENPIVLSNQPKDTLRFVSGLTVQLPDTLAYTYAQLSDLLDQVNAKIRKQSGTMSKLAPQAKGLTFQFRSPYTQTMTIVSQNNSKTLRPDRAGAIAFPLDKQALSENPTVTVSVAF
jgi:hypothetical protein